MARISDADPDVLRYLAELGLGLDAEVHIHERREYAGTMAITWGASSPLSTWAACRVPRVGRAPGLAEDAAPSRLASFPHHAADGAGVPLESIRFLVCSTLEGAP
ncbi:FeoA family protein [Oerskovia sp. M15]